MYLRSFIIIKKDFAVAINVGIASMEITVPLINRNLRSVKLASKLSILLL